MGEGGGRQVDYEVGGVQPRVRRKWSHRGGSSETEAVTGTAAMAAVAAQARLFARPTCGVKGIRCVCVCV